MFSIRGVQRLFGAVLLLCVVPAAASAEPVITKTYSYFRIGGRTAEDLDRELEKRGPVTRNTGHRHPGATEIKFGGEVTYMDRGGRCSVGGARVTLRTHIILPRWSNRNRTTADLAFIWDTLSADIKRHEERHAEIARTHARQLERELLDLLSDGSCDALEKQVADTTRQVLQSHDRQQLRFDQVEAANFDSRMMRLLRYHLEQKKD
jgi:predicted secreted Zn-dependent protease